LNGYRWLNDLALQFLKQDYLLPNQTVDERVSVIGDRAEKLLQKPGFAGKFKDYFKRGWFSLSTPIWINFGTDRGLPISCYGSSISDSMESILYTHAEVGMMTKFGGGTSAYFGELRCRGQPIRDNGQSSGSVHFMGLFETELRIISQGAARRGNCAVWLPIDHCDIEECLQLRTEGNPIQDLSYGICVPDYWLEDMIAGDAAKRAVWAKVLQARANTGYPYLFFTDNVNAGRPKVYKDKQYKVYHSNLCSEICLPDGPEESFVCDLSSMNVLYFEEWKDTDAVEVLTYLLDAVMEEFIRKAQSVRFMERPVRFAKRHRALGIGWLGWHSLLQSKGIPFESMEAKTLNVQVAKTIEKQALAASRKLAKEYGEPEVLTGYGMRNATLTAIAPTKSSSFILGQVSEGIEPIRSNYMVKDLAKGKFTLKNTHLEKLLEDRKRNTPEVWESILKNSGSVQHLKFLSERERAVFKTFSEISPMEIVQQAAQRQKYIDQSQSLNLLIDPKIPVKDVNALLLEGWRMGVKTFYYQISVNAAQQLSRSILSCTSCEA
jgi:ribonucleoside-diphosphate reductase alpha chain